MKYETYEKICGKHKINPHQVIADGNIREILERDKDHVYTDTEKLPRVVTKFQTYLKGGEN